MKTPRKYEKVEYQQVPEDIRKLFEKTRESRRGIYIYGDVGTGKTHIAYAIAKQAQEWMPTVPVVFWNTTELLDEMRKDIDRDGYSKVRPDERIMESRGLLFLDDLGAEKVTDWVGEKLYMMINKRYNEELPMIITSNLPIASLSERIGDRTVSRIVEMCDVVELKGEDRRINNKNKITINLK